MDLDDHLSGCRGCGVSWTGFSDDGLTSTCMQYGGLGCLSSNSGIFDCMLSTVKKCVSYGCHLTTLHISLLKYTEEDPTPRRAH